jgi:coenzyme F420-reducing hydrogenase delta subunit
MPDMGRDFRIIGFLCNWCSYGGADAAGVARFSQPTDLRIIRVPCSGRVDPMFVAKALLSGADGVLVSGCHPRDCHYSEGNFYARRRLEMLRRFLPILGVDEGRFEYVWVSASEGSRWRDIITKFTEKIHELGPMPRMTEPARTLCTLEGMLGQSLAQPDMGNASGGHASGGQAPGGQAPLQLPDWSRPEAVLSAADIARMAKEEGNG